MKKLYYGAAYYPELWDEKDIEVDIQYMKKVGIDVVRMGEFAWSKFEPQQDQIDTSFFVNIINKLNENGIKTIFCTPTPTPPIWMTHGHSERLFVNKDGERMGHGSRQHCCTNNDYFINRVKIIVEAIAKDIGNLDGVIKWQIDNEFKCHVGECICDSCKAKWHIWLENKYKNIDALNKAWGTDIWSEKYLEFCQVPVPSKTPFLHNASLLQAYTKFTREKIAEFCHMQANIIRKYTDKPITHNSNMFFPLDNELLFKNLDFASFDDYPDCDHYKQMLFNYDLWKTVKPNVPFWVMETSPSHNGSLIWMEKPHNEGYLKAEAVAAYASGAEGFSHWLWRQQKTGCEITHGSILSAWGTPAIGYNEVLKVAKAKNDISDIILNSKPKQGKIAITYSDNAKSFLDIEPTDGNSYSSLISEWYERILDLKISRDCIHEGHNFDGYEILMSPFMQYISDDYINRALKYVENGGIWMIGPMSGYRTIEHTVPTNGGLGKLGELAGVDVEFVFPMSNAGISGEAFGIKANLGRVGCVLNPISSVPVGTICEGIGKNKAFITEKTFGKGKIVLIGALPIGEKGDEMLKRLIQHYLKTPSYYVTDGTIIVERENTHSEIIFAINMDGQGGNVVIDDKKITVNPYDYEIIQIAK